MARRLSNGIQGGQMTDALLPGPAGEASKPAGPEPTKHCPVCGELIWVGALKCIHCDTDFSWRRYLAFSNTTLALVTALISVMATSAPVIRSLLTPEGSKMSGVFAGISTSGETLSMLFNNDGKRAGAINRLWFTVLYKKDKEIRNFSIYPHTKGDGALYLQPGKTTPADFIFANSVSHWGPQEKNAEDLPMLALPDFWEWNATEKNATCTVRLSGINADGSEFKDKRDVSCTGQAYQMFRKLVGHANQ
jgi:predicted nucleic acid-binding Zn ribbon protein